METNRKYKIGEWVFHRMCGDVSHGKIVGYEDGFYVIETMENDILCNMHLTDKDVSRNYEELNN